MVLLGRIIGRASVSRIIAGVVVGLAVVVTITLVVWDFTRAQNESEQETAGTVDAVEILKPYFPSSAIETVPVPKKRSGSAELRPDEVIDNLGLGCSMETGRGSAADLAIVTVSEFIGPSSPTRFSVLNGTGALRTGKLPFYPFQRKLGKRPDGSVVAGYGGMNLLPSHTPLPPAGHPLRIFVDDLVVYENDHTWLFDVAPDGSSYFVIESLGSGFSSRLVISNWEQGTEVHYDLGTLLSGPDGALAYLASYTSGGEEVHLQPVSGFTKGLGVHHFFKVQGGTSPREINVPNRGLDDRVHFTSSGEGYVFYEGIHGADGLHIVKASFDWPTGESTDVWRRDGPDGTKASHADISPDGAWILFNTGTARTASRPARDGDHVLYVLDAETGEPAFALPTQNVDAQKRQLSSVLPAQPTVDDVGWFNGAFFAGNDKLVLRWLQMSDGEIDEKKKLYDVFDLESISLVAQPEFRVEGNQHRFNPCASKGFPGTLRVAENGRLAYASLQ